MSGHVSHVRNPGVEFSTGSLGHGLSVSAGIAHSIKTDGLGNKIYCVLSDGEMGEGSNWEALLFAAHHSLDNLTALIDRNNLQSIKGTEETLALEPLAQKIEAFGWNVLKVDGHDHTEILTALNKKVSGSFGYGIFSFYGTKNISTFEGGMICIPKGSRLSAQKVRAAICFMVSMPKAPLGGAGTLSAVSGHVTIDEL